MEFLQKMNVKRADIEKSGNIMNAKEANGVVISAYSSKTRGGIENWMYHISLLLDSNGVKTRTLAYREGLKSIFLEWLSIFKADYVFCGTWKALVFLLPFLAKEKRVFVFFHGNDVYDIDWRFGALARLISLRSKITYIANSEFTKDLLISKAKSVECVVINPFLEVSEFLENECNKYVCSKKRDLILVTISRLTRRKNISSVISALAEIRNLELYDNIAYDIVGEGSDFSALQDQVRTQGMESVVRFHGSVSEEEKYRILRGADIFILPSILDDEHNSVEGFGMVFIEANSVGLPVVGGKTGGMVEAIKDGETGYLSDGTISDIRQKLILASKHSWSKSVLVDHARHFDYRNGKGARDLLALIEGE